MILQAFETLPSSSASCSRESFLLVLWESVVIWVLRIVGCLAITNLPRRPGWLRPDLTPCVVETGRSQQSENYETSSHFAAFAIEPSDQFGLQPPIGLFRNRHPPRRPIRAPPIQPQHPFPAHHHVEPPLPIRHDAIHLLVLCRRDKRHRHLDRRA